MSSKNVDQYLIDKIINGEWEEKIKASDCLVEHHFPKTVCKLIALLNHDDPMVRNASALALKEIKDNNAVKPLLRAIKETSNMNNRATLVYALESLDCSEYFIDIFKLALANKADVFLSAMNILHEQRFLIDDSDISKAFLMLENSDVNSDTYKILSLLLNELSSE